MEKKAAWRGLVNVLVTAAIVVLAVGLLVESDVVAEGIRNGLVACGGTLIPALFPFMALSGFLSLSDYGRILSIPLRPLVRRCYRVPGELGPIILLSLIGGFPVGARSIASLLEQGRINRATAERMLCFCVNCGPSFLITAVGARMLGDIRAGLILFLTQTAATLLVGLVVSFGIPLPDRLELPRAQGDGGASIFVQAVTGAAAALFNMCAFAVLFSGIFTMINNSGIGLWIAAHTGADPAWVRAVISGFFEVTGGCIAAASLGGTRGFLLLSLLVSFGGLSVMFQVMSCFRGMKVRFLPYIATRLLHMALAAMMAMPLYRRFCAVTSAWAVNAPVAAQSDSGTLLGSVCLIAMSAILVLTIGRGPDRGKWRKSYMRVRGELPHSSMWIK